MKRSMSRNLRLCVENLEDRLCPSSPGLLASPAMSTIVVSQIAQVAVSGVAEPAVNAGATASGIGGFVVGANSGWIEKVGTTVGIRGTNYADTATVRYTTFLGGPVSLNP